MTGPGPRPYGQAALVVPVAGPTEAHRVVARLAASRRTGRAPEGVTDVVPGLETVVVHLDDGPFDDAAPLIRRREEAARWMAEVGWTGPDAASPAGALPPPGRGAEARRHTVPVVFDGPDLAEVADAVGRRVEAVVDLLVGAELTVAMVGFAPGFPYLTGLPEPLAALPRRARPRAEVPAGSVAVAGGMAGIYPDRSPGGWHLVGRTDLVLFDPDRPPYARLGPGDTVRFTRVAASHRVTRTAPGAHRVPAVPTASGRPVSVVDAGGLCTVQDRGRMDVAHLGVPRAGPCDPEIHGLANLVVGNVADAPALEITGRGPTLRFGTDAFVAVVGRGAADPVVTVDGHPVPGRTVVPVRAGQTVVVGSVTTGLRAALAVDGGFVTDRWFGSSATDLLAGLGPGPLVAGTPLACGPAGRARGALDVGLLEGHGPSRLRVVAGPHGEDATLAALAAIRWRVAADSNRVGLRLEPDNRSGFSGGAGSPEAASLSPVASLGMVTGAVQLPPGGEPVVLLADHATIGGYPVVACMALVDLPLAGQLRPGDRVDLTVIPLADADAALLRRRRALGDAVRGWYPTRAGT